MRELQTRLTKFSPDAELHDCAKEILGRLNEHGSKDHQKFVNKSHSKYKKAIKEKPKTYGQDWQAYNKAQQKEKLALMSILIELVNHIPVQEKTTKGRKPFSLVDKLFFVVMQAYNQKSSRRCISDLEISKKLGYITKEPYFTSVLKTLKDPTLTSYLKYLIELSSAPLRSVETDFAVDSSGFSTSLFGRWFDIRTGKESNKRQYRKVHIICGVKTNIIASLNITSGYSADSPEFTQLIKDANQIFQIKEVSADMAYSSHKNLEFVDQIGAIPFIPFKSNVVRKGLGIWGEMLRFSKGYPDEFFYHYHKRSNVETTFHMIKRKFGSFLRSRTETGQSNELLAKCLCHNLCILVQESMELGIDIDFKNCPLDEIAHKFKGTAHK
ncbi:MAG: transposase [Candidatus Woesearchaeota archaeon]|jgi:transposase